MATIEQAIRTYLLANATDVTTLVGTRIVPDVLAQGETIPAIVYRRITAEHYRTITGSTAGMANATIEYACFNTTRIGADDLAEKLRLSGILDLRGTYSGIFIADVELSEGFNNQFEQNTEGSHELRYITSQDYTIHYRETV